MELKTEQTSGNYRHPTQLTIEAHKLCGEFANQSVLSSVWSRTNGPSNMEPQRSEIPDEDIPLPDVVELAVQGTDESESGSMDEPDTVQQTPDEDTSPPLGSDCDWVEFIKVDDV